MPTQEWELLRHMGRVLTKFQQLGFRALVPQTSNPLPRLSRRVM